MKDSKPVESFETSNKEFRITQKEFVLMEETNYSVKVRSIRKNDDGDKFSEYSQAANFFVKKEIEQVNFSFFSLEWNFYNLIFSLNQRKLFHWMDLGKHYPLIGMMIL